MRVKSYFPSSGRLALFIAIAIVLMLVVWVVTAMFVTAQRPPDPFQPHVTGEAAAVEMSRFA